MSKRVVMDWTITVDRPADEVFAYLADIERHHEWASGEFRVEDLSEGPLAVGSTWTSYGFQPPNHKDHRNDVTVTELVSPSRLVFVAKDGGEDFVSTFDLTSVGDGTRVDRILDVPKPGGAMGLAFGGIVKTIIKPGVQKTMETFKSNIESASTSDG
jgi:uncharacterized protein YndB with AHSA1/START domain